jgi:hypothetical protein
MDGCPACRSHESPACGIPNRAWRGYPGDVKTEELVRYEAMYRAMHEALGTPWLEFGFSPKTSSEEPCAVDEAEPLTSVRESSSGPAGASSGAVTHEG